MIGISIERVREIPSDLPRPRSRPNGRLQPLPAEDHQALLQELRRYRIAEAVRDGRRALPLRGEEARPPLGPGRRDADQARIPRGADRAPAPEARPGAPGRRDERAGGLVEL